MFITLFYNFKQSKDYISVVLYFMSLLKANAFARKVRKTKTTQSGCLNTKALYFTANDILSNYSLLF